MDEQEWLTSRDPLWMLESLGNGMSPRQLRLFACAYARTSSWLRAMSPWNYPELEAMILARSEAITLPATRDVMLSIREKPARGKAPVTFRGHAPFRHGEEIVRLAEEYADGRVPQDEFQERAAKLADEVFVDDTYASYVGPSAFIEGELSRILCATLAPTGLEAARLALGSVHHVFIGLRDSGPLRGFSPDLREWVRRQTRLLQAELLREIVGNPFRPVCVPPMWLSANDGAAVAIAAAIERDRDWERMPILGDALEEAGCTDVTVLSHCREAGEHARGCWVVDRILGREQGRNG